MDDQYYMNLALELARATLGQTAPNPSVAAIVVKNNQIIGIGTHLKAGLPHAEVYALKQAGQNAEAATLYVTLEPCVHFGKKTAPCVDLIIQAKIKKVVVAVLDPNPLVNGRGVEKLRAAGIDVVVGVMVDEALKLNQVFFNYMRNKTPFITLKAGMSLDGKLATVTGQSKWITNELARSDAHKYRHTHDAILVGVNTIIADDPALTTRIVGGGKNPIRIILDTHLRTPLTSQVLTDKQSPTWIVVGDGVSLDKITQYQNSATKIIQMDTPDISINQLVKMLADRGVTSILVEGGHKIHTSFLMAKQVNQVVLYVSPLLIGGEQAAMFFAGKGFASLDLALKLEFSEIIKLGDNLKIVAMLQNC